jgi:acetolactate synthase-1/2/3 large subunit
MQPVRGYRGSKIHPAHSVEIAREVFPPEAIMVSDGGNTSLWNMFCAPVTRPRTMLGIFEFGHLGTGIPSAIGAKLANPDKDVFVVTGDGAAGFNFMELATALREGVKITVMVHADESWTMEETACRTIYGEVSEPVACDQLPIRWDKVAEGIGCHGEYVEKTEDLADAIKRAKASELPALVCVKTDKEANLQPPGWEMFLEVYTGPLDG